MFRFDENDPQFLIVYTGDEHPEIADYRNLIQRWESRLSGETRFGVIIVREPHEHHDDDAERHREDEAEITGLINDFRRRFRTRANRSNLGYTTVLSPEMATAIEPEHRQKMQDNTNRFAQYSFGVRGAVFTDVDEAKAWLREQEHVPLVQLTPESSMSDISSSKRVGLFYGSTTGVTEYVADEIKAAWEAAGMEPLVPINIATMEDAAQLLAFDYLILGIPTWNIGQLQDDWEILFPQLDQANFTDKQVALFGIGDQKHYDENFLDALGMLAVKLRERGATLVGLWETTGYEFTASEALENGRFMGLGIDEVNQPEQTTERIQRWVAQIIDEFALEPVVIQESVQS